MPHKWEKNNHNHNYKTFRLVKLKTIHVLMIFNKHYYNSALNLLVYLPHKHYILVKSFLFDTYYVYVI